MRIKESSNPKKIKLEFEKELNGLAGNSCGKHIFDRKYKPQAPCFSYGEVHIQIEPHLKNNNKIIIKFPKHIEIVTAGFVQGIAYKLGVKEFENKIKIDGNPSFVDMFYKRLE